MSNEMKVIMERWDRFLLQESAGEADVSKAIVSMFDLDKAEDQIEDEASQNDKLNEFVLTGGIALAIFTKMIGTLALGGLLAQISNWFHKKITGEKSQFVERFSKIVEEAASTLATLGLNKIIKTYIRQNIFDEDKKQDYIKITEQVSTIIVFIITLGAAGTEVYQGAKEAGGLANHIAELAKSSGIENVDAMSSLADLFENSIDVGENTFKATGFIKQSIKIILQSLGGTS
tara:strand:+ start:1 stop:696 length:696 start_codon:yes stop_codon:yes gene_type:complete